MVSREQKRASLHDKLQILRTLTHSHAVRVQVLEKGFLINVFMDKSSPGLLASILEAFDGLGLTVLEARASCSNSFRLQAVGAEHDEADGLIDANAVELAVMQAIKSFPGN
uniref:Plant bHLH transcription factor ACT-like domain-containing protein n=1 Tax=Leersia perrieri TaxID=77586 RepID=A0A0D9WF92_9ORYZ